MLLYTDRKTAMWNMHQTPLAEESLEVLHMDLMDLVLQGVERKDQKAQESSAV